MSRFFVLIAIHNRVFDHIRILLCISNSFSHGEAIFDRAPVISTKQYYSISEQTIDPIYYYQIPSSSMLKIFFSAPKRRMYLMSDDTKIINSKNKSISL